MKKTILNFYIIGILLFTSVLGLAENSQTQGPSVFLPEEVFEFQPVLEGTEIVHKFAIYNRGEATLEILKIQSG